MPNTIFRIHGLLDFLGIILFLFGVYLDNWTFIVVGGLSMVFLDVVSIFLGSLNPLFPLVFAFILGFLIEPWWYGVFWSMAIFYIFNIPIDLKKIFRGAS